MKSISQQKEQVMTGTGNYESFKDKWDSDREAEGYRDNRFTRSKRWRRIDREERRIIAAFLSSLPVESLVVDIPCGSGRLVEVVKDCGMHYHGVDISFSMLRLAWAQSRSVKILRADAVELPFRDRAFSALLCIRLLHRIQESYVRISILREFVRIVNGPILVSYYRRDNIRGFRQRLRCRFPGLSPGVIKRDAASAGLQIVESFPLSRWTEQQWFFRLERDGH